MGTNIVIDDDLLKEAQRISGKKTKREVVELGLQSLIRLSKQSEILKYKGRLHWEGNLDDMRTDR